LRIKNTIIRVIYQRGKDHILIQASMGGVSKAYYLLFRKVCQPDKYVVLRGEGGICQSLGVEGRQVEVQTKPRRKGTKRIFPFLKRCANRTLCKDSKKRHWILSLRVLQDKEMFGL
jgi:hypothetical protein